MLTIQFLRRIHDYYCSVKPSQFMNIVKPKFSMLIISIIAGDGVYHTINERYHLRKCQDGCYTDIYSGKLYQNQAT